MRHRLPIRLLLALALVALAAAPAGATIADSADQGGRPLHATLAGAAERPGPGDPDGSGTALITLNQGLGEVCWELTWTGIATPVASHIHVAPVTAPGPVVVPLSPTAGGCAAADPDLIKAIRQNPGAYYVNIHTAAFPAGAIRGQLSKTE